MYALQGCSLGQVTAKTSVDFRGFKQLTSGALKQGTVRKPLHGQVGERSSFTYLETFLSFFKVLAFEEK